MGSPTANCWANKLPDALYIWRENLSGCLDPCSKADVEYVIPCLITSYINRTVVVSVPQTIKAVALYQRATGIGGDNMPVIMAGSITSIRSVGKMTEIVVTLDR